MQLKAPEILDRRRAKAHTKRAWSWRTWAATLGLAPSFLACLAASGLGPGVKAGLAGSGLGGVEGAGGGGVGAEVLALGNLGPDGSAGAEGRCCTCQPRVRCLRDHAQCTGMEQGVRAAGLTRQWQPARQGRAVKEAVAASSKMSLACKQEREFPEADGKGLNRWRR